MRWMGDGQQHRRHDNTHVLGHVCSAGRWQLRLCAWCTLCVSHCGWMFLLTFQGTRMRFQEGPLHRAITKGKMFIAEELNLAHGSFLSTLAPVLEGKSTVRNPVTGEVVEVHPNFCFMATQVSRAVRTDSQ